MEEQKITKILVSEDEVRATVARLGVDITACYMRTAVALEHDRGNTDFTFNDFLNKAFNLNKNE